DLIRAYSDVRQKVSEKKLGQGYVRVECIDGCGSDAINSRSLAVAAGTAAEVSEETAAEELCETDYKEATLARLADTVDELRRKGVRESDMTILIRFNKQIPTISEYFSAHKPEIRIVSDEAFRLDSSPALLIIIMALKLISNPDDDFTRSVLAYKYQTVVEGQNSTSAHIHNAFLEGREHATSLLPEEFNRRTDHLSVMPLYELSEELYKIFSLDKIKNQDAYLFCFYDCLTAYLKDNPSDIDNFIGYWDTTLRGKTIPNGAADGIRIMSIHKSKGLEFHTVLVPFCDWELVSKSRSKSPSLIWCEPDKEPFNELPLAPIDFTDKARDSIFKKDYEAEVLKNYVDNLNLIYVAFTRAECNLFIFTGKNPEKKKKEDDTVGNIYRLIRKALPDNFSETEIPGLLTMHERGNLMASKQTQSEEDENVVSRPYSQIGSTFKYFDTLAEFRQSNKSTRFINGEEEDSKEQEYIDEGLLFHRLFSMIEHPDDIDKAVRELDCEGCFASQKYKNDVSRLVHKAFSNTQAATWFSPKWQTFNECSILFKDEEGNVKERRPDRVIVSEDETIVIDYKTGKQSVEHEKQVREYMQLLKQMGHTNIKGYIWYIRRNDIVCLTE
ncbi:MAG: PD-(D/E)XK nuclease family protein, partial [Bacteroides sp.]|nr:PD-(D/E)XK nuclease family protein [Bacteroides sp.]